MCTSARTAVWALVLVSAAVGAASANATEAPIAPTAPLPNAELAWSPWFVLVFACGVLAAAAGVGGGALYTPIFIVCFGFVHDAIPLSKAAVLGCALSFFALTVTQPAHVEEGDTKGPYGAFRYRFAYDVILVMEPATLLGTVFGVILSRVCPYWLIAAGMVTLLTFSARKTFAKSKQLRAKEENIRGNARAPSPLPLPPPTADQGGKDDAKSLLDGYGTFVEEGYGDASKSAYLHQNTRPKVANERGVVSPYYIAQPRVPAIAIRCLFSVLICYASVLALAMATGKGPGGLGMSAVECGSGAYWAYTIISIATCAIVTFVNVTYVVDMTSGVKTIDTATERELAVLWPNPKKCYYFAALCVAAGLFSALVGIGGSTIKGPIVLYLGLNPTLAKSTAQLMLLSTVSSSLLQFLFNGMVPVGYGVVFFAIGAAAGIIGKVLVDGYVSRHGRQSVIAYALAWYIVAACVTMTVIGVMLLYAEFTFARNATESRAMLWFRGLCAPMPETYRALGTLLGY